MRLQIVMAVGEEPDEIVGIAPWRDKIVIATRRHVLVMEHDEEIVAQLRVVAQRYAEDGLP